MLDMGTAELAVEIQSELNRQNYSKEELYTLWERVQGGNGERERFDMLWESSSRSSS